MINKIKSNIIKEKLINKGDNILIGLSGGPDSVFMFHILYKLQSELGFTVYASHINHMYREEAAEHDEQFVRDLCEKYNVKLFVLRKNAEIYARELKLTEEEAGRKLRYDFFYDNLNSIGGGKIAVAHNLNDQAETVLQRLIRGTGTDGLSAMSFENADTKVIRPILNISREDIENYLHENKLEYCTDYTNLLPIYGRNKIRLNLIPYLRDNYNPNIVNTLYRMSQVMSNDSKIIEKYTDMLYNQALIEFTQKSMILNLNYIKTLEDYEIGRLLRKAISLYKGNTVNVENKHIEYGINLIRNSNTGKTIDITDGIVFTISYDKFIISKKIETIGDFEYNITIGESTYISEIGKTVLLNIEDYSNKNKKNAQLYVDYDTIKGILRIRNKRNSDTMIPCGMNGSKKLKDIFIDNKVPKEDRCKKLILTDDEKIIYLEDFRISNKCKTTEKTRRILTIRILEENNEQPH